VSDETIRRAAELTRGFRQSVEALASESLSAEEQAAVDAVLEAVEDLTAAVVVLFSTVSRRAGADRDAIRHNGFHG